MDNPVNVLRRGRKPVPKVVYRCRMCQYTSSRFYNVNRHEYRIHTPSHWKRHCCDSYFMTKGEWYLHCEQIHPTMRAANLTSRGKYKILTDMSVKKIVDNKKSDICEEQKFERVTRTRYALRPRGKKSCVEKYRLDESETSSDQEEDFAGFEVENDSMLRESSGYESKSSFLDSTEIDDDTALEKDEKNVCKSSDDFENESEAFDDFSEDNFSVKSGESEKNASDSSNDFDTELDKFENFMKKNSKKNIPPLGSQSSYSTKWKNDVSESGNDFGNEMESFENFMNDNFKENIPSLETRNFSYLKKSVEWETSDVCTVNREGKMELEEDSFGGENKKNEEEMTAQNLPIKKRILYSMAINKSESKKEIRRLNKIRNDENANFTRITVQTSLKRENEIKVEVRTDPGISWLEITRVHREYFENLLLDSTINERLCLIN